MVLAYKPTQPSNTKLVESANKVKIQYSETVSRNATTLGSASTTISNDFIATYVSFSGYVEAFDANPKTRTYFLYLNNVLITMATVVNPAPTAEYQGHENTTMYLDDIKVYKNSTLTITCGGSVGNTNSGTFILGGYLP
jgi:hypothetical protein